jgi:glycerol-3-phosphate dehydrogenase
MNRDELLGRLRDPDPWDLVIVGGGATGLGSALDAALRGYRTLLIDQHDFAKGTSSRSTKLIHGGVRYLARGQFGLVHEALDEQKILLQNAPNLVRPLSFVIPAYHFGSASYYGLGLRVYDWLAGGRSVSKSRVVSLAETLALAPNLEQDGLRGGVQYHDAQFDDARLAIALLRSFLDAGGTALNYMSCVGFLKSSTAIRGITARDAETGAEFAIASKVVLNATGVFADGVRRLDQPDAAPIVRPSQGIHLVLPRDFSPGDSAILVPKTDDGRVLFVIPWHGKLLLGTTDTPLNAISEEPKPLEDEIDFLLKHAQRYLRRNPERSDVLSVFAGLRPLVSSNTAKSTKALSREHAIFVSPTGLVTIVGGKWTTYRRMAADAVDRAAKVGDLSAKPSVTETHRLHGAAEISWDDPLATYGSDADGIRSLAAESPEFSEPLAAGLPYLGAEVVWAARHEMARTVEDVLSRRTRALFLDARAAVKSAPRVAELLARELNRDVHWRAEQVRTFGELAETYILAS